MSTPEETGLSVTETIPPGEVSAAAEFLRSGKLVAFPTDTFFALGSILTETAVSSLFEVKGRMAGNPVPVLLSSERQVPDVALEFPAAAAVLASEYWPGPLTLVLPARSDLTEQVTAGTGTVGVRVPRHQLARNLIELVGRPLTGTSANRSGSPPCKTEEEVRQQLDGNIAAVIHAPCGEHSEPSTVVSVDRESGELRVIRVGAIPEADLLKTLQQS